MSPTSPPAVAPGAPGATRSCPHCRATILESSVRCPKCQHHLRFDPGAAERANQGTSALAVEATIKHPEGEEPWEYSVLLIVRNEKGEEVSRQVMGVGALTSGDLRSFALSVDITKRKTGTVAPNARKLR
jgi:hypothetical protein